MTTTEQRDLGNGLVIQPHDHTADHQVCADCALITGAGITTEYDAVYYAQDDPTICPRCGGDMEWMRARPTGA